MTSHDLTQSIAAFLQHWGELGPVSAAVVLTVFVVTALMPVPRTVFVLATGMVFGLPSIPLVMVGTTIGCVLAFLAARHLFAMRVQRAMEQKRKLTAIMDAVDAEGWRIVALCRLASPIPSMIQSLLFGITRIGLWPYTWATFVFTVPLIVLYVYLGTVGKEALLGQSSGLRLGLMAAGGVMFLIVVTLITRRVRASMREIEARRVP